MMLQKMPVRWRLTVLSVFLLTVCCVGLTAVLNLSAGFMANTIEATLVTPAQMPPSSELPPRPEQSIAAPAVLSTPAIQAAKIDFFHQSVLYMIVAVVLGGALTYYLSGKALKPLHQLSSEMQKRTVNNLSQSLPVPQSKDEIAYLTQSFNEMSQKLEEAFAMQKRFSQSAAHELRTPLTVLKTKVEVFQKKPHHTAAQYDALLDVITTHTNRLADLVKDLLDLSNMDALPCDETLALTPLLSEVCVELASFAKEKNLSVGVTGIESTVQGNRSLLYRLFYNLVENAIKYNQENGAIDCRVAIKDGKSVVTICDTGIGISAAERAHIFEPFYRVDKSRSRQMGGAGLGLATAKAIVQKHGGTLTVQENPNGGTIFEVVL